MLLAVVLMVAVLWLGNRRGAGVVHRYGCHSEVLVLSKLPFLTLIVAAAAAANRGRREIVNSVDLT